jgi:hypothetical protein
MICRPLFLLAALNAALPAQALTWVEGAGPTDLSVRTVPEAQAGAPPTTVLARVEILGIEISNRTRQQGLRDDLARLVDRRGIRRVELPGNGSLFRYRREGGRWHGFLHVAADGSPRVLLEEAGLGAGGTAAPFADRIGVAPDGRHALVPRVDGAVHVVRLDGGRFASSGTASRLVAVPGAVDEVSATVGRSVAWCASQDDRVWRIALADGGAAVDLTPAGVASPRLKPEFAPSADGRAVVFLYGPQRLWSLFLLGESGASVRLPPPPSKYEEPGYLPETADGPRLLLNDDATRLLYVDAEIRDETFVLDVAGFLPATHWTGDPNFQPYIGVIILPVAIGPTFVAGIGDPGRFDLHAATAGVPGTVNLTRTSAAQTAPWTEGSLLATDTAVTAGGQLLAGLAPSAGGLPTLFRFEVQGPVAVALELRAPLRRGTALVGVADYLAPSRRGDVLVDGASGRPLLAAPPGVRLTTPAGAGAFSVFVAEAGPLRAGVLRFADGSLLALPGTGVRDLSLTASGGLVLDDAGGLRLIDRSGVHAVQAGAAPRVLLSGLGTGDA